MLLYFVLRLVGAALLTGITTAQQLSNDPPSYFGGLQNEEYLDWVGSGMGSKYNSSVYLPSIDQDNGAAVHWSIDGDWLHIAVAARCSGWIGFGISEAGGMKGSDMALFTASRPTEIIDAYVVENRVPEKDSCQQDWTITESEDLGEFLTFAARRKLDTGDPQDKKVVYDGDTTVPPSRIIAAWGNDAEVSYHGTNVARGSVRFYSSADEESIFQGLMETNSEASFLVLANNYTIPSENETLYVDFCVTRSDLIEQGVPDTTGSLYLIGFRPIISPQSAAYVHHFVVYASTDSTENACGEDDDIDNVVYVWAPGDGPFALPNFLGAPMFGSEGFQSFSMEVHYNNPGFDSGIVDNSGVEFFFTSQPREFEMGVLQVGDSFLEYYGSPIGDGLSVHSFECSSDCSSTFLGDGEPVTVIREHLHMHMTGTRMTNEQLRDGKVVRSSNAEVWEFDQNGNLPIQQGVFQILPGDSFRTSCYYRGKADTVFGLASAEEMCMSFLYYYPRVKSLALDNFTIPWFCGYSDPGLEFCFNEYTASALDDDKQLNRQFGQCVSDTEPEQDDEEEPVDVSSSVLKGRLGLLYAIAAIALAHLL